MTMTAATKKRRRRSLAASTKSHAEPPDDVTVFEEVLAAALEANGATEREIRQIENTEAVAGYRQEARRHVALEERAASLPEWERQVEGDEVVAQGEHRLSGHRGPAPTTDGRRDLDAFRAQLSESRDAVKRGLKQVPVVVKKLLDNLRLLDTRQPLIAKQHSAVERALAAADDLLEAMVEASELQDDYESIVDHARFFTITDHEVVRTNGIDLRHDGGGVRGFVKGLHEIISGERERLRVAGLHLKGEISEKERPEHERAERFAYQQALQKAAAEYRRTDKGEKSWQKYKQIVAAYNDASGDALSETFANAKKLLRAANRDFYTHVAEYAQMEIHEDWFLQVA